MTKIESAKKFIDDANKLGVVLTRQGRYVVATPPNKLPAIMLIVMSRLYSYIWDLLDTKKP